MLKQNRVNIFIGFWLNPYRRFPKAFQCIFMALEVLFPGKF